MLTFVLNRQHKTMKHLSAVCTLAVIVLLLQVAQITTCYAADSAADPNASATADSGSDMMMAGATAAVAAPAAQVAQAVAPETIASDRILVIRIPIPENNILLAGIVAGLILVTAAAAFIRYRNNKSSAAHPKAPADSSNIDSHADNASAAKRPQSEPAAATAALSVADAATAAPASDSGAALHPATPHPAAEVSGKAAATTAQTINNVSEGPTTRGGEKIAAHTLAADGISTPEASCTESAVPTAADTASKQTASHVSANTTTTAENAVKISTAAENGDAAMNTASPAALQVSPAEAAAPDITAPADTMSAAGTTPETIATPSPSLATTAQHEVPEGEGDALHIDMSTSAGDRELRRRIEDFVAEHMHNVELSVDDIAGAMYMSRSTLFRSMKRIYGMNPNEYLRQRRLSYAADLLQQNKYTISDICLLVGFNSPSYFSSCFKKQYNVLPKDYRAR